MQKLQNRNVSDTHPIRALVLLSGGLDSQLAVVLLKSQGIKITGITFKSIFFDSQAALAAAERLDIPLKVIDFTDTIIGIIEHPRHGFGAGLNPCIDCHIAMIKQAGEIMRANGFHFVASGEVLNERPMSQNRRMLPLIAQESGLEGYLLRPLSAKLLAMTEPEKRQWVDREKLLAIEGRSRRPQLTLAREFGLTSFPQPAGGCLLTDPGYGKKLRDLRKHEGLNNLNAIQLLRVGRHFRLGKIKLIVGRNQADNEIIERAAENKVTLLKTLNVPGPVAIISNSASEAELGLAAATCARYSDHKANDPVAIEITDGKGTRIIEALPAEQSVIDALRV
ncbi:MAG: tRNA 4-thiouridine(8) synthase ThiI [Kiritimatiellia bacterium]|nr:tRNA 4-thiouridine(8) synthase ThiI [Kiritimatiellia bacterium]